MPACPFPGLSAFCRSPAVSPPAHPVRGLVGAVVHEHKDLDPFLIVVRGADRSQDLLDEAFLIEGGDDDGEASLPLRLGFGLGVRKQKIRSGEEGSMQTGGNHDSVYHDCHTESRMSLAFVVARAIARTIAAYPDPGQQQRGDQMASGEELGGRLASETHGSARLPIHRG